MQLTKALKDWAVANLGVAADADDATFKSALSSAIVEGKLTTEKFTELSTTKDVQEASVFEKKFDELLSTLRQAPQANDSKETDEEEKETKSTSWYESVHKQVMGSDDASVRVKGAHEQYATTKSAATFPEYTAKGRRHPNAGQPIRDFNGGKGRVLDNPSDLDIAVVGAWSKFQIQSSRLKSKQAGFNTLNQHERELLLFAINEMKWSGSTNGDNYSDINNEKLSQPLQKALIDDATSGGLEAAPIVFDDMVIQAPLLTGELFPRVTTMPLDRGRRVEGVSVSKVTGSWGGVDDTAITLFNTSSFVSAFDTTIYRWQGAIKIGLDFMSDTPIDFGALITAQYGERLAEDLDDVIAAGNGTNQPEGIITKSGTTSVTFGSTMSISNMESLRFGVSKAEHKGPAAASAVFCGTEASYQRARAVPVGAADARRIFGMDYSSYRLMERDFAINESLTDAQIFYAIMSRYRMYIRRGLTMRSSVEGDTLIRANEMLITCTARFGGQLERGACAAVTTDAPTS